MATFNVSNEKVIKYANKLDLFTKKVLKISVRNTLNTLAFETKKKTLLQEADKSFINRNKTFFRRFSRVQPSKLGSINEMASMVGMVSSSRGGGVEQAGEDMTQQQKGGTIRGRTFIPLDTARTGKRHAKNVRPINRIKNINIVLDTKEARATKVKQRFIQSAVYAVERFGSGAVIQHERQDGKTFLYRIERGGNDINTRQFNLKVTPLYSVKKGRSVKIKDPKPFTLKASLRTRRKADTIFIKNAKRQLKKVI